MQTGKPQTANEERLKKYIDKQGSNPSLSKQMQNNKLIHKQVYVNPNKIGQQLGQNSIKNYRKVHYGKR